jgi:hypothetical protein
MPWDPPAFEEIKMDAELTAYCDDLDAEPSPPGARPRSGGTDDAAACESVS